MSTTYYGTNVSSGLPQTSSFVYSNSAGTSSLSDGWYGAQNNSGFSPTHKFRIAGGAGGVQTLDVCSGGGGFPSQRSLKEDIKLIGVSPSGLNMYSFKYKKGIYADKYPGTWQGVMAAEVKEKGLNESWFWYQNHMWVDYEKLDVEFKKIKS